MNKHTTKQKQYPDHKRLNLRSTGLKWDLDKNEKINAQNKLTSLPPTLVMSEAFGWWPSELTASSHTIIHQAFWNYTFKMPLYNLLSCASTSFSPSNEYMVDNYHTSWCPWTLNKHLQCTISTRPLLLTPDVHFRAAQVEKPYNTDVAMDIWLGLSQVLRTPDTRTHL